MKNLILFFCISILFISCEFKPIEVYDELKECVIAVVEKDQISLINDSIRYSKLDGIEINDYDSPTSITLTSPSSRFSFMNGVKLGMHKNEIIKIMGRPIVGEIKGEKNGSALFNWVHLEYENCVFYLNNEDRVFKINIEL